MLCRWWYHLGHTVKMISNSGLWTKKFRNHWFRVSTHECLSDCCSHNCTISIVGWGPFDSRRLMRRSVSSTLSTGIILTKGMSPFLEHFVISLLWTVPYILYERYKMVYAFCWLLRSLKNVNISCSQWIQFFDFMPIITWLCQHWRV